jgi:hypothetical protein
MPRALVGVVIALVLPIGCRGATVPDGDSRIVVEAADVSGVAEFATLLPAAPGSVKFAVIGDSGRGNTAQRQVADTMSSYRRTFPFTFVLMLGDNIYESQATADDYRRKFEEPYRALLDAGVRFFAVLGNHDDPNERFYPPFNMDGEPYYTFRPPGATPLVGSSVRFFALNSTWLDGAQFAWLGRELDASNSEWKIVLLHHPIYTGGRYRLPAQGHRVALERLFVRHGVSAVFSGHEHFYQRSTVRQGVQYFVSGAAGSLRRGDARRTPVIARSYDADYHFMLVEIAGHALYFQAVTRTGTTIDAGVIRRRPRQADTLPLPGSLESSRRTAGPTLRETTPR